MDAFWNIKEKAYAKPMKENEKVKNKRRKYPATSVKNLAFYPEAIIAMKKIDRGIMKIKKSKA